MDRLELENEPPSIRAARDFVANVLAEHGIDMWQAVLVTSELAANVVAHARTPYTVGVGVSSDEIRIEVQDGNAAMKVAIDLANDSGGYGLRVVESLATAWGVDAFDDGKVVWVRLPIEPSSAR